MASSQGKVHRVRDDATLSLAANMCCIRITFRDMFRSASSLHQGQAHSAAYLLPYLLASGLVTAQEAGRQSGLVWKEGNQRTSP